MSTDFRKLITATALLIALALPAVSLADDDEPPLFGATVGIDPGHQDEADDELEPVAPASDRTKPRMSAGCVGVRTGTAEADINLMVAEKLAELLTDGGAEVVLTRTDGDVDMSNMERATLMNDSDVDIWIRIHCNFSARAALRGASALAPSEAAAPHIWSESEQLADYILAAFCDATGAIERPVKLTGTQTGFNWSESPVVAIEMGYLSNAKEDLRLNRKSYQMLCAEGIYEGILDYYGERP